MQPTPLVDIGINLTHESYDHDREAVLARAAQAGVAWLIITGASVAGSRAAARLAAADPARLAATAGIHPHHAADCTPEALAALRSLLAEPCVVAGGECGLDYYRMLAPAALQEAAFRAQVELAIEARRPLFLHCRDAHADFARILASYGGERPRAVVHCFTGTRDEVAECLALGLYVGITGWICDERRGLHLREVVRAIPADRLLLETDGPYLLPRDLSPKPRDRRNEPAFLVHIARAVAAARGESTEALAAATTANALALFGLGGAMGRGTDTITDIN
jgi:TatD DNase family protein